MERGGLAMSEEKKNAINERYFIYTNTNILRDYCSSTAILASNLLKRPDTPNYYFYTISDQFDWGLFATNKLIKREIHEELLSKQTAGIYPVAIELETELLNDYEIIILDNNYNPRVGRLKEFNKEIDIGFVIRGFLPLMCARKAIFRSFDEKLEYERNNYGGLTSVLNNSVEEALYKGDCYELNFEAIRTSENKIINLFEENFKNEDQGTFGDFLKDVILEEIRRENQIFERIKGCVLASLGNFRHECITRKHVIDLGFDDVFLNILNFAIGEKGYNAKTDYMKLLKAISDNRKLNAKADYTPYKTVIKILSNIVKNEQKIAGKKRKGPSKSIENINNEFYRALLMSFLDPKESGFNSGENFIEKIEDIWKKLSDVKKIDNKDLKEGKELIKQLKAIYEQQVSIPELLEKASQNSIRKKYSSFIALALILSLPEFEDLVCKIEAYKEYLDPYLKRLVLSMYGAIMGISSLDSNYKNNEGLLWISEMIGLKCANRKLYESIIKSDATINKIKRAFPQENKFSVKGSLDIPLYYEKRDIEGLIREEIIRAYEKGGKSSKILEEFIDKFFRIKDSTGKARKAASRYLFVPECFDIGIKFKFDRFVNNHIKKENRLAELLKGRTIEMYKGIKALRYK